MKTHLKKALSLVIAVTMVLTILSTYTPASLHSVKSLTYSK